MAWLKRNLFFVLSMVAGLALTGFCAYLFSNDLKDNKEVNKETQDDASRYSQLRGKNPYPSEENVKRAKDELSQVEGD